MMAGRGLPPGHHRAPTPLTTGPANWTVIPVSEPILEITKLNKSFGPVHVLHDVDLNVYPGEVTALVGDNGAGKSTLVKCIAGINHIDSGEVKFEGKPVVLQRSRASPPASGIEFVYQDLALADNLDITQNMFLGREIRQVRHARRRRDGAARPARP